MYDVMFTIPGRLPGFNDYMGKCRANRFGAAKYKKDIEAKIVECINDQCSGIKFGISPIVVRFEWYEPSPRRDKDNIAFAKKFIFDAMQKQGILTNDSWSYIDSFNDDFFVDKDNPRVEVKIWIKEKS